MKINQKQRIDTLLTEIRQIINTEKSHQQEAADILNKLDDIDQKTIGMVTNSLDIVI